MEENLRKNLLPIYVLLSKSTDVIKNVIKQESQR